MFEREGTQVKLWLIHADAWQKPTEYCKAIILQLKINLLSSKKGSCGTYTMEYYSDIKTNAFESVLMRQMKLEPIIQSEVGQKEKHQYSILTHIYGIQKDSNDDPICKTAKETQM